MREQRAISDCYGDDRDDRDGEENDRLNFPIFWQSQAAKPLHVKTRTVIRLVGLLPGLTDRRANAARASKKQTAFPAHRLCRENKV
jgi:hypothetical protein